jgi:hypothetical protein
MGQLRWLTAAGLLRRLAIVLLLACTLHGATAARRQEQQTEAAVRAPIFSRSEQREEARTEVRAATDFTARSVGVQLRRT